MRAGSDAALNWIGAKTGNGQATAGSEHRRCAALAARVFSMLCDVFSAIPGT